MKARVKSFVLVAIPTAKNESKNLDTLIDKTVNEFLGSDGVESAEVSVSVDLSGSYPKAVVIVKYVPSEKSALKK